MAEGAEAGLGRHTLLIKEVTMQPVRSAAARLCAAEGGGAAERSCAEDMNV